jgi:hypothetical protein
MGKRRNDRTLFGPCRGVSQNARPQYPIMNQTRIRLTRTELYEKVWTTPMRTLADEFSMSDVGLAKICRRCDVPVPPVGCCHTEDLQKNAEYPASKRFHHCQVSVEAVP